jgi:hypothetical protein
VHIEFPAANARDEQGVPEGYVGGVISRKVTYGH